MLMLCKVSCARGKIAHFYPNNQMLEYCLSVRARIVLLSIQRMSVKFLECSHFILELERCPGI